MHKKNSFDLSFDLIDRSINNHSELIKKCFIHSQLILDISNKIYSGIKKGAKVFWYGNGGSAADAQHMAAELVSRFKKERRAIASVALTTDTSILTAIGNDYTFDNIFERQVEALVGKGDICIGLSTSGNSKNVYLAHQKAKSQGAITISLLGNDGGITKEASDYPVVIPSSDTPRVQEVHTLFAHIICELVENMVAADELEELEIESNSGMVEA